MPLLRSFGRTVAMLWTILEALCKLAWLSAQRRRKLTIPERAAWLQQCCRVGLRRFGVSVIRTGPIPEAGLIVSNHLSYLDILILSAVAGAVFISKREVASWPLFGMMAKLSGSIFVKRERYVETHIAQGDIRNALASGACVVLFPESTSSDGSSVLPFRSPLFEPVIQSGHGMTGAYISYEVVDGEAATDVCYWGEMTLLPHMLKLLSKPMITARLRFTDAPRTFANRKEAALQMHEEVVALAREMKTLVDVQAVGVI